MAKSKLQAQKKRALLNLINRKSGNYGNGDNLDVSHRKDGSTRLEKASKNRGRKGEGGRKVGVSHDYPQKRDSRLN